MSVCAQQGAVEDGAKLVISLVKKADVTVQLEVPPRFRWHTGSSLDAFVCINSRSKQLSSDSAAAERLNNERQSYCCWWRGGD